MSFYKETQASSVLSLALVFRILKMLGEIVGQFSFVDGSCKTGKLKFCSLLL